MPSSANELVVIQRNPTSGSGRKQRVLLELIAALKSRHYGVRLFSSRSQLDRFMSDSRLERRVRCLVAAGGDGTVSSLFSRHPEHAIAVLPMGTENLVARHLQMPCDGRAVADVIRKGHIRRFDTAAAGNGRFLLMASAGIDAEIVRQLQAVRSGHIRHWTYLRPILRTVACYRLPRITVTDRDTGRTVTGSHVIVSNFREYGLNLKLNPDADPTDGQLDVCVFQGRSLARSAIHAARSVFHAQNGPLVVRFRSQHVTLSASGSGAHRTTDDPDSIPVQVDGDFAGQLPVDIRINASALQLLVRLP